MALPRKARRWVMPAAVGVSFAEKRVLVVEDSEIESDSLVAMLLGSGLRARAVMSGEEALLALLKASEEQRPIDLVVMDWRLPGIHGIETARRIQAAEGLSRTPAILILSAFERSEVLGGVNDPVLEGFLMKPVTPRRLIDAVTSILHTSMPGGQLLPPPHAVSSLGRATRSAGGRQRDQQRACDRIID